MNIPAESIVTVQEVLHLSRSQSVALRIVRRTFHAAVPASALVGAVAVVLAVRLVVFAIVGDKIVQGEPVVRRDEVDARLGLALLVGVQ
jgi:hypothetical protein